MIHYLIFKAISLSDTTHCRIIQTKQIITSYILHKYNGAHCRLSTKIWIDLWHRHFQSEAEMAASKTIHFKIRDKSLRDMHTLELKIYLDFICDGNDLLVIDRINCILFHNLLDPALKFFFILFLVKSNQRFFKRLHHCSQLWIIFGTKRNRVEIETRLRTLVNMTHKFMSFYVFVLKK